MKIKLDEKEMATILVDWAKRKYKTHNVSPTYGIEVTADNKLKAVYVELEVTLSEDQITDAPAAAVSPEMLKRIQERTNDGARPIPHDLEPDFSPQGEYGGMPL